MKEIEHNTWIQGNINTNILKDELDWCILMWKDGQDKWRRKFKNSMHGMIFVVRNYIHVHICTRKMKGHEMLMMIFFWEKNGRMRVLERKEEEQHEISSGYQSHCNLHIVPSPVFFVTYTFLLLLSNHHLPSLFLNSHRSVFSHTFLNLLFLLRVSERGG